MHSFQRSLRARNRSPKTLRTYTDGVVSLDQFLEAVGMPRQVANIRGEHIEAWLADQLERLKATTARARYGGALQFFRWLEDEGEVPVSPMSKMRPPQLPDDQTPIVTDADLNRLVDACRGKDFEAVRDLALVRLFISSGPRLSEVATMSVDDLRLDQDLIDVTGKGRRYRPVPLSAKAAVAIDRYVRVRKRHPKARLEALWLGGKGPLTDSGIAQILRRRSRQAGIDVVHPHQLRHTAAVLNKRSGRSDTDMRRIFGWSRGSTMVERYGAIVEDETAQENFHRSEPDGHL
ncbi:MAG: tyrosine-type recombinase/integrase [Actinomycetota bacterium]